ncbi:MAE_28990/MAE_18760 family HEPN-like nuclease [Seohaeicola zhoushanensis]|nr:MAE_28990/MAE_18760 family HEPN-like nuclease [Seohaeicola zhoushanensis]
MSPLEIISQDLDWREAELGSLKVLLIRRDTTDLQKLVLLRACWALLYAHYEGFVKTAMTIFYDEARKRVQNCGSLPKLTRLFALERMLRQLKGLPPIDFLTEIEDFVNAHHAGKPTFPEVETKSNLWPNVFSEILDVADLSVPSLETHKFLINTLVSRRNNIAHGQRDLITDISYYRSHETAVYDLMYELSYSIDERLRKAPYV